MGKIKFNCTKRNQVNAVPDDMTGLVGACIYCREPLKIPARENPTSPPAPKPPLIQSIPLPPAPPVPLVQTYQQPPAPQTLPVPTAPGNPLPVTPSSETNLSAAGKIEFQCPYCMMTNSVSESMAGLSGYCSHCGKPIFIPGGTGDLPSSESSPSLAAIEFSAPILPEGTQPPPEYQQPAPGYPPEPLPPAYGQAPPGYQQTVPPGYQIPPGYQQPAPGYPQMPPTHPQETQEKFDGLETLKKRARESSSTISSIKSKGGTKAPSPTKKFQVLGKGKGSPSPTKSFQAVKGDNVKVPCPRCQKTILESATQCPYCKTPVIKGRYNPHGQTPSADPNQQLYLIGAGGVVVLILLMLLFFLPSSTKKITKKKKKNEVEENQRDTPNLPKVAYRPTPNPKKDDRPWLNNPGQNPDSSGKNSTDPETKPQETPALIKAALEGDLAEVRKLLSQRTYADVKDPKTGKTPLHIAAKKGLDAIVKALLNNDANPDFKDNTQSTPLHYAVGIGKISIVKMLLERDVEMSPRNSKGETPLFISVNRGDLAMVKFLLEKGADAYEEVNGVAPLKVALKKGYQKIARLLGKATGEISAGKIKQERQAKTVNITRHRDIYDRAQAHERSGDYKEAARYFADFYEKESKEANPNQDALICASFKAGSLYANVAQFDLGLKFLKIALDMQRRGVDKENIMFTLNNYFDSIRAYISQSRIYTTEMAQTDLDKVHEKYKEPIEQLLAEFKKTKEFLSQATFKEKDRNEAPKRLEDMIYFYRFLLKKAPMLPEIPELSGLVLSQLKGDFREDGYLLMDEISKLKLEADFVCLSACETGLGRVYQGEGVVGLIHSFLIAGANSVCVSLWSVADQSTTEFMIAVYKLVKVKHISYSQAITEVKRLFIKGKFGDMYKSPFFWAPFVYYGR